MPQTVAKVLLAEIFSEHTNDARAFGIAHRVEDCADLRGMMHLDFNRVGMLEAVGAQCGAEVGLKELCPDVPFREDVVDRKIFNIRSKAFVEPQMGPPLHGHQITEPLVCDLVRDDKGDPLLVDRGRLLGVD